MTTMTMLPRHANDAFTAWVWLNASQSDARTQMLTRPAISGPLFDPVFRTILVMQVKRGATASTGVGDGNTRKAQLKAHIVSLNGQFARWELGVPGITRQACMLSLAAASMHACMHACKLVHCPDRMSASRSCLHIAHLQLGEQAKQPAKR